MNKSPIIIFEGLDRVGKGSHIDKFTKILEELDSNYLIFHCEGPDSKIAKSTQERIYYQLFTFYNQLKSLSVIQKSKIIFDRSFFGEAVWSKYYNRLLKEDLCQYDINQNYLGYVVETIMNTDAYKELQERMIVVFLDGNEDIVAKRIKESEEDTRVYTKFCCCNIEKNVSFIKNEFNKLYNVLTSRGLKTLKLQSNSLDDIDKNISSIFSEIKMEI